MIEKMYQLISRDGLKSEMRPRGEMKEKYINALIPKTSLAFNVNDELGCAPVHEHRQYRYRQTRTIEIYEYEEF